VVLDLDGFKAYNDAHGHAAGDRLLKRAASSWADTLRTTDLLARTGGDEFVAVLPDCPPAEAARVVARFRERYPEGHSFSAGIASWNPYESVEELLARADLEMYRAKDGARSTSRLLRSTPGTGRG
jgi:diguanylate cyclase (GGDEF)-like protein